MLRGTRSDTSVGTGRRVLLQIGAMKGVCLRDKCQRHRCTGITAFPSAVPLPQVKQGHDLACCSHVPEQVMSGLAGFLF